MWHTDLFFIMWPPCEFLYCFGLHPVVIRAVSAQPARVVRDVIGIPTFMRCAEQHRGPLRPPPDLMM